MPGFVTVERSGRVATLTFDRPTAMNALSSLEDCLDVVSALEEIDADPGVSVAIVTGRGRAFSAGGNIQAMRDRTGIGPRSQPDETRANYRRGVHKVARAFYDCETPLIAAFNGHALGVGLDLGCLCDIRIAADNAKFAASFIKLGLVPGDGGAWILSRAVGYAMASELLLTGDGFGPAEALSMGLVSHVVPPESLMPTALDLAHRIAANPARAVRLTKRLLRESQTQDFLQILELSSAFQAMAHETGDHAEAVDAFLEKRPPVFTGA